MEQTDINTTDQQQETSMNTKSESYICAESLVNGSEITANILREQDAEALMASLIEIRNEAFINNNTKRVDRCESLLMALAKSLSDSPAKKTERNQSKNKSESQSFSSPSRSKINNNSSLAKSSLKSPLKSPSRNSSRSQLQSQTKRQTNSQTNTQNDPPLSEEIQKIIDDLLNFGKTQEKLTPSLVSQVRLELRRREDEASSNSDYQLAQKMATLGKSISNSIKEEENSKKQIPYDLKIQYFNQLKNAKIRRENLDKEYEATIDHYEQEHDKAQDDLFQYIENKLSKFNDKWERELQGDYFHQSPELTQIRQTQKTYARHRRYDLAEETRQEADKMEQKEKAAYRNEIEKKQKYEADKLAEERQKKLDSFNRYWNSRKQNDENVYKEKVEEIDKEIRRITHQMRVAGLDPNLPPPRLLSTHPEESLANVSGTASVLSYQDYVTDFQANQMLDNQTEASYISHVNDFEEEEENQSDYRSDYKSDYRSEKYDFQSIQSDAVSDAFISVVSQYDSEYAKEKQKKITEERKKQIQKGEEIRLKNQVRVKKHVHKKVHNKVRKQNKPDQTNEEVQNKLEEEQIANEINNQQDNQINQDNQVNQENQVNQNEQNDQNQNANNKEEENVNKQEVEQSKPSTKKNTKPKTKIPSPRKKNNENKPKPIQTDKDEDFNINDFLSAASMNDPMGLLLEISSSHASLIDSERNK